MRAIFILYSFFTALLYAQEENFSSFLIPDDLSKDAKAVVLADETRVTLKKYNLMKIDQALTVTIFKTEGDDFRYFPMFYDKYTKIISYGGEVYDANGKLIKKFKSKDYTDQSAVGGGALYSDDRVLVYEYVPTTYPFTIKHWVTYETSNTAFIPGWTPVESYDVAVISSSYDFINESDAEVQVKELNFDVSESIISERSDKKLSYKLTNFSALDSEIMAPSLEETVPRVLITPNKFQLAGHDGNFSDWKDFGSWLLNDLVNGRQDLPADEIQRVKSLLQDITDTKEKIRILYQYMQNRTRYINIAIGIGGWQPYPASYVSSKGYGDCKALTNYMMALLKSVEIPSNYTVVYGDSRSKRNIRPDFAAMQGNHVILQVPLENDTVWLECTSQQTAFNHLGSFTSDRYALALTPEGGKIVKTQMFPPENNRELISAKGKISEKGQLDLDFTSETTGIQYDYSYYVHSLNRQDQENWLQQHYSSVKGKKFNFFEFENDRNEARFIQNINLTSASYGQLSGNNLIFPVVPVGGFSTSLSKDSFRKQPLNIPHGYSDRSSTELEFPSNFKLNYIPEPVNIQSEFGSYSLQFEPNAKGMTINRSLDTNPGIFPKEKFIEYVEFRRAVEKADNTKILLEK